jgi:transposase-like protein
MTAHFWLQSKAVPLTLEALARLSDEQAWLMLAKMRWGNAARPTCPDCAVIDKHYCIRTRKQWRCKHCFRTFSVTTATPFSDHRIGYRKLLLSIFAFVINQKGLAALALRRIIGRQYRTSFTILHRIREAVMVTTPTAKLQGVVEIDGGHFSSKKRKGRKKPPKATAKDKTELPSKYAQHRDKIKPGAFPFLPNRRIVIALREISPAMTDNVHPFTGKPIGKAAARTVVAVCRSENAVDIESLVKNHVQNQSLIRTDELPAYGNLKYMGFTHETVNHSVEFSTDEGVNQNQAESFFSRMRRACIGIYHRITPRYMIDYASEMAWREDIRRDTTNDQFNGVMCRIFDAGLSTDWTNYCRGNKRRGEILFQGESLPTHSQTP